MILVGVHGLIDSHPGVVKAARKHRREKAVRCLTSRAMAAEHRKEEAGPITARIGKKCKRFAMLYKTFALPAARRVV